MIFIMDHILVPLCMPDNLELDSNIVTITLLSVGYFYIAKHFLDFCSGIQLFYLETVWYFQVLFVWCIRWIWSVEILYTAPMKYEFFQSRCENEYWFQPCVCVRYCFPLFLLDGSFPSFGLFPYSYVLIISLLNTQEGLYRSLGFFFNAIISSNSLSYQL